MPDNNTENYNLYILLILTIFLGGGILYYNKISPLVLSSQTDDYYGISSPEREVPSTKPENKPEPVIPAEPPTTPTKIDPAIFGESSVDNVPSQYKETFNKLNTEYGKSTQILDPDISEYETLELRKIIILTRVRYGLILAQIDEALKRVKETKANFDTLPLIESVEMDIVKLKNDFAEFEKLAENFDSSADVKKDFELIKTSNNQIRDLVSKVINNIATIVEGNK